MNHLTINVDTGKLTKWLKARGWRRTHDELGRLAFIRDTLSEPVRADIAVEMQIESEVTP